MYYYSVISIRNFMKMFDMNVIDFKEISNHSGSIRFYVKKADKLSIEQKAIDKIEEERKLYSKIDDFSMSTKEHLEDIKIFIKELKKQIISKDNMTFDVDYVFIFAWNYAHMIMEKLKNYNFKYIVAFPEVQVVSNYEELKNETGI